MRDVPARSARRKGLDLADRQAAAGSIGFFLQALMAIARGSAEFECRISQTHYAMGGWLLERLVFHRVFHSRVENSKGVPEVVS
jgi:hypothetical protein